MESLYAEVVVKPKQSLVRNVIMGIVFFLVGAFFIFACYAAYVSKTITVLTMCLPFLVSVFALTFYFFRQNKIEYEYIYCDDVIDIAKIRAKQKRKTIVRIETDNIELFAPVTSAELKQFNSLPIRDFSSEKKMNPVYAMITVFNGKKVKVLIEPSEKMLSCLKIKLGTRIVLENK